MGQKGLATGGLPLKKSTLGVPNFLQIEGRGGGMGAQSPRCVLDLISGKPLSCRLRIMGDQKNDIGDRLSGDK